MGLFDFLKKKKSKQVKPDDNTYIRQELKRRLEEMGHSVCIEDGVVYADSNIGILIEVLEDPNLHPMVVKVGVRIVVEDYFGKGLSEVLAGIGDTIESKANSALNNLLTITLPPILDAFTDSHNADIDFTESNHGRDILWHPKPGNLGMQGKWDNYPDQDCIFHLLKDWLKDKLVDKQFNWLKIYIAKQADGSITGDCSLNNEFYEDGYLILEEHAKSWENIDGFRAIKQFILFRQCDACKQ